MGDMSWVAGDHSSAGRPAPRYALWLLAAAPFVALPLAVWAEVAAALIAPLGDPAPPLILVVSLLARRWSGVQRRLFDACVVLAAVATAVHVLVIGSLFVASSLDATGILYTLYLIQMRVLLVLFGVACLLSCVGLLRLRRREGIPSNG
jgi:choline-glycine betaine transporter